MDGTRTTPRSRRCAIVDKATAKAYMENLNCNKLPRHIHFHLMTLKYIFSVLKDEPRFTVNPWKGKEEKKTIQILRAT